MDKEFNEYKIDADNCPKKDIILTQYMCKGCLHYKEFFWYYQQRYVRCTYLHDMLKDTDKRE